MHRERLIMPARIRSPLLTAVVLLGLCLPAAAQTPPAPAPARDNVTIYRCTDSTGRQALRDTPCLSGERQQTRQMQRPQDPPPREAASDAVVSPAPAAPTVVEREVRVVTVQPPTPMYACIAPDGAEYISEDGRGNPRWVPFLTTVWPVAAPRPPHPPGHGPRPPGGGPGGPGGPRPPPPVLPVAAGGTWVQDPCQRLPQQDVCRRLSDRRYEILRIYGAGMPSDRRALDREQQDLDARMGNDCPGY